MNAVMDPFLKSLYMAIESCAESSGSEAGFRSGRKEEPGMESKLIKTVLAIELIKDLTGYGDDDWSSVDDDEW